MGCLLLRVDKYWLFIAERFSNDCSLENRLVCIANCAKLVKSVLFYYAALTPGRISLRI